MRGIGLVGALAAFALTTSACGLDGRGRAGALETPDASASVDAGEDAIAELDGARIGADATLVDGSTDGGTAMSDAALDAIASDGSMSVDGGPACAATCNGQCVTSCTGCAAGEALCAATHVCGNCAGCVDDAGVAHPIECFSCDQLRMNPIGTCEVDDPNGYCLSGSYSPRLHCSCAGGNASACPGPSQVCVDIGVGIPVCATCGESGTDRNACKVGTCRATGPGVPHCM